MDTGTPWARWHSVTSQCCRDPAEEGINSWYNLWWNTKCNSWECFIYCWCTCSPDKSYLWNTVGFSVHWEGLGGLEAEEVNHGSVCWAELVLCSRDEVNLDPCYSSSLWQPDTRVPKGIGTPGLTQEPGMSLNSPGTIVVIFRWGF